MPKFAYAAVDVAGQNVEGVTKADTIGEARAALLAMNVFPVRLEEKRSMFDIEITKEKLPKRELMHFTRQLAVFVRAGIPITSALEVIGDEAQDKVLRRVITDIVGRLRDGSTFAAAVDEHPEAFPAYFRGILGSAELTGNLDSTLDDLSKYIAREIDTRQKVTSALTYPMIVVALSLVTVAILAGYVLPQFRPLFDELNADLPLPTRMLLFVADLFTVYWYIPFTVFLGILGFIGYLVFSDSGKRLRDRIILKVPVLSGIVEYAILERFCRVLSAMLRAGVPLPDAMRVTIDATSNHVYVEQLEVARDVMLQGAGFTRPIVETGLFPGAARQMFKVGEETGTLDQQLAAASEYFDSELEVRIKKFTTLFEPAMIIFVGAIVGFVAMALVSAMYGVLNQSQDVIG
jgi:type IV pilus assembly protein PilC